MIISLPQNNCSAQVFYARAGAGCCAVCVGPVSSCRCIWRFYFLDKKAECVGECSNMHLKTKHSCNWPQIFAVFLDELSFEPKRWQRDIEEVENHLQHYIPAIPLTQLGFFKFYFIFYCIIFLFLYNSNRLALGQALCLCSLCPGSNLAGSVSLWLHTKALRKLVSLSRDHMSSLLDH